MANDIQLECDIKYYEFLDALEEAYREWLVLMKGKHATPLASVEAFIQYHSDNANNSSCYYSVFQSCLYDEDELTLSWDEYYNMWGVGK